MSHLRVDDHKLGQELLPKALPECRDLVEGARRRRSGVRTCLVREVHPLAGNLLPRDPPVTSDGSQEALHSQVMGTNHEQRTSHRQEITNSSIV